MSFFKYFIFTFAVFTFFSIFAGQSSISHDYESLYAGGAAGQQAECPNCGKKYLVGTHHKCSKTL